MTSKVIPKPPADHWLFKNGKVFTANPAVYLAEKQLEFGEILELNLPLKAKRISLTNPDFIKYVLVTNNKNYIKDYPTRVLKLALGNGLLTSEGDFWRRQRRIAQPAFHKKKLALLAGTMTTLTARMLDNWENRRSDFDVSAEMMFLTSEIVAKTLFGADIENLEEIGAAIDESNRFLTHRFRSLIPIPLWVPTSRNRTFIKNHRQFVQRMQDLITERRQDLSDRNDLLTMLISMQDEVSGERMTNQQLIDECITLFAAGHETSANGLTWIFNLLSQHEDVRHKLQTEVETALNGRQPTPADLPSLPYTLQVIQESMRLYPPAWAIGREALADDEIGGYHIPKGSQLIMCTYAVHRNPRLWENPEKFDPERFTPEKQKDRHKYAYFPFGGGPRLCIGNGFALMEMQLVLAMITQRYQLALAPGHPVEPLPLITLKPKFGLNMHIRQRY